MVWPVEKKVFHHIFDFGFIPSCLQTKFIRMSWRGIPQRRDDEAISLFFK